MILCLAACKTPIGVEKVGPDRAYAQVNENILSSGQLSSGTRFILHRFNLEKAFVRDPRTTIQLLHEQAAEDRRRDTLFALSELSLAGAERQRRERVQEIARADPSARKGVTDLLSAHSTPVFPAAQPYYLSCAVYAYLYLFSPAYGPPPSAFERQFRLACDLYSRGLLEALRTEAPHKTALESATRALIVGQIQLRITRPDPYLAGLTFDQFMPADDYTVRGLTGRDRTPGLGAPFIAVVSQPPATRGRGPVIAAHPKIPVTALLRLDAASLELNGPGMSGAIELSTPFYNQEVRIGDQIVPIETDSTATLAYGLQTVNLWKVELTSLLSAQQKVKTGLYRLAPYAAGKIPVVFVHGTASSPARWGEMFNTLNADPLLCQRYQFWFFIYNTGNPILYSASLLRDSLHDTVRSIDPDGQDPALKQIVVIGHSQGGLLARVLASSNTETWASISRADLQRITGSDKDLEMLERTVFFAPSPYLRRVVYVSTPHGGSYRVGGLIQWLARRVFRLPGNVLGSVQDLRTGLTERKLAVPKPLREGIPNSFVNMKPGSLFSESILALPRSPHIRAHSIISVKPGQEIVSGNDGVVAYSSAHIDDVDSEFVVRWSHSCQSHPSVIEEVRRILLLNLRDLPVASSPARSAPQPLSTEPPPTNKP